MLKSQYIPNPCSWIINPGCRICLGTELASKLVTYLKSQVDVHIIEIHHFTIVVTHLLSWLEWLVYSGNWSYIHTIRKPKIRNQVVEVRTQLTHRDFVNMLSQKDDSHFTIFKKRRCFLVNNQYFQLDIYKEPCHPRYVLSAFYLWW